MRQRRSEDSTDDGDSTDDRPTPVDSESSEEAGRKTPLQRSGKGTPRRRKSNPSVVVLPFVFAFAIVATAILAWFQFSPPAQETLVTPPTVGQATSTGGEAFGASGPTFATDASVSGPSPTDSVSRAGSTGVDEGTTSVPSGSPKHRTGEGLIGYEDERCGPSRAVHEVTQSSGPNGSQDWLNCGLSRSQPDAPWTPPHIKLSQIKTISLGEALAMDKSVYTACEPFVPHFEKYADANGVPPILLAAFAMQESSCRAGTMGDAGGAYGLMQITEDKCGGAPGGDCRDPEYNIRTGAAYFAQVLQEHDENLLLALGAYNGWYDGLTYLGATAARHTPCCECQNNLDYHHAMLNGWLQGLDGSQMGTVRNLEVCRS